MEDAEVRERSLKRLAMQIAVQLPDQTPEAMMVLRLAGQLVTDYIDGGGPGGMADRIKPFVVR